MKSEVEGSPLDSGPEAGTSNILKSLWFPPSTIPTRKSGQIVYGCASLLGEQWDFFLTVFSNWQGRVEMYLFHWWGHLEISWPFLLWAAWGGVWPQALPSLSSESSLFSSSLTLAVLLLTILSLLLAQWPSQVFSGDPELTTVAVLLLLLITGVTVIIWRQPQDPTYLYFKVGDLMCPKCPPWVNEVCMLWGLNILCWTREEGELLKPLDSSLIHTQCFTNPI